MTHTPGLGLWASCTDYGLDHTLVDCTGPASTHGARWICCTRCADSWPAEPAPTMPSDPPM